MKILVFGDNGEELVDFSIPDEPSEETQDNAEKYIELVEKMGVIESAWRYFKDTVKEQLAKEENGKIIVDDDTVVKVDYTYGIKSSNRDKVLELAPEVRGNEINMSKFNQIINKGGELASQLVQYREVISRNLKVAELKKSGKKLSREDSRAEGAKILNRIRAEAEEDPFADFRDLP